MAMNTPLAKVGSNGLVSPDRLRMLAKKACALHVEVGTPLSGAVVQVLRSEPGLGSEHIRRVVEFTNNDVFQHMFEKASGAHRLIEFDGGPADPSAVLKELRMEAAELPVRANSEMPKLAFYIPGMDSAEDIFETQKTASTNYSYVNPLRDLFDTREKLNGVRDYLTSSLSSLENRYDSSVRELCKVAYQLVLNGTGTHEIATAISRMAPNHDFSDLALKHIQGAIENLPAPKTKIAAAKMAVVNTQHPLAQAFREFVKTANDRYTHAAAVDIVTEELAKVNLRIKELI